MAVLFDGIPLGRVSTSMTINATAVILLSLYVGVARRQNVSPAKLSGTVQNDILKEYVARGTYIYPPRPSLRIVTDLFAYCARELPNWNTISISGYHIREAGSPFRKWRSPRHASAMQKAFDAGLDVTSSGNESRSSTPTTISGDPIPGGAPVGRASCATVWATNRGRSSSASTPRRPAARRRRSSRTTISPRRPERWRRARRTSRSTATGARKPCRCRARNRRESRCGRSKSSRPRPVRRTRRSGRRIAQDRKLTDDIERRRNILSRIERRAARWCRAVHSTQIQEAYGSDHIDSGKAVVVGVNRHSEREASSPREMFRLIRPSDGRSNGPRRSKHTGGGHGASIRSRLGVGTRRRQPRPTHHRRRGSACDCRRDRGRHANRLRGA